ncbi:C-type lectin domain family 2 member D-like isoform X1 [Mauremys reevesii]|uniref:C-type lectin domain family 2 member D-like isoform X1 n=1 Tax=Mauremys reevesii TaxID=260615 RepID=UPI00193EFBAF|nr:C-type lectin domain family 2 member D-like isoform X1 [Mauremys reevesii]
MSVQAAVSWALGLCDTWTAWESGEELRCSSPLTAVETQAVKGNRLAGASLAGDREAAACTGNGHSCRLRKRAACTVAASIVLVVLVVAVVALAVLVLKAQPQFMAWCPDGWIGYQGKCYYFSEGEKNWTYSQSNCSAFGASLAVIDSKQDLAFMMRYKGVSEHWIGLWREQEGQPWKWVNGSDFNSSFPIRAGGHCAYLDDKGVSSSRCTTERNWVCSKPDAYTSQKNATQSQELKSFTMAY